jgi:hypothetical protein
MDHHHSPINGQQQMPTTSATIAQTPSPPAAYEHKWVIFNSKQCKSIQHYISIFQQILFQCPASMLLTIAPFVEEKSG